MVRKNIPLLVLIAIVLMFVAAFLFKNDLNHLISEKMKQQAGTDEVLSGKTWVDSLFNYSKNRQDFKYSLLEFKSSGCAICKKMEPELEKVRNAREKKINVVVLNVMNPNSQNVMTYFGISAVPTQILLDHHGEEVFRNYGFISAENIILKTEN